MTLLRREVNTEIDVGFFSKIRQKALLLAPAVNRKVMSSNPVWGGLTGQSLQRDKTYLLCQQSVRRAPQDWTGQDTV